MKTPAWSAWRWAGLIAGLSLLSLVTHGYHPLAEDGGLYVAGVEWTLDPALFSHGTAFVTEHLRFSVFAPAIAAMARWEHVDLARVLLEAMLASAALTLLASRAILRRCGVSEWGQLGGVALLGAAWTMPVAGTSLLLMDPYVTARSFSSPLSLLAVAWAMDNWRETRAALWCGSALVAAGAFHPLMAMYALGLVIVLRVGRVERRWAGWCGLAVMVAVIAGVVQGCAAAESAAVVAAAYSRYYWFLSQWRWFEVLGLVGPLVVLGGLMRWRGFGDGARRLMLGACVLGLLAVGVALVFAHEGYRAHAVARLQPLRVYLQVYGLMVMLLGAAIAERCRAGWWRLLPVLLVIGCACGMFAVQRMSFPASQHLELPWRAGRNPNAWVQAFVWVRGNTARDALFAIDAKYVNTEGEDAQTFRATAERSVLPDYSKDGGEAAITPALAEAWQQGARAQKNLSQLQDVERDARLRPLGVTWMVLHTDAVTAHPCAYRNAVVKVCELR